jgi:hypothetical protein
VSFLYQFINENGFTLEQDIFIGMAYFQTGNFDAANGWQYSTEHGRYIAPISTNVPRASWYFGRRGTLVAFRQHCTRLVQRYLQTGDVKKAKPTGRTSRGNVGKVATQSKVATYHFFKTTTAIFRHNHRISVTCTTVKLATN